MHADNWHTPDTTTVIKELFSSKKGLSCESALTQKSKRSWKSERICKGAVKSDMRVHNTKAVWPDNTPPLFSRGANHQYQQEWKNFYRTRPIILSPFHQVSEDLTLLR